MKLETRLISNSTVVATNQEDLQEEPIGNTIQYIDVTNLLKFQAHHQLTMAIALLEKLKEDIDLTTSEMPTERFNPKSPTGS